MKLKKISACAVSLTLVFSACVCAGNTSIFNTDTVLAALDINVEHSDGTKDESEQDKLYSHVDISPLDITQYSNENWGERYLVISNNNIAEYTSENINPLKTLIYDGQDIEKLRTDFPELQVSQINDSVQYDENTLVDLAGKEENKTYFALSASTMSEGEFLILCSRLNESEYSNDLSRVKFVTKKDSEGLMLTFNYKSETVPDNDDFPGAGLLGAEKSDTEDGTYTVQLEMYTTDNDMFSDDVNMFSTRDDISDIKYNTISDMYFVSPSWCYMYPLSGATYDNASLDSVKVPKTVYGDLNSDGDVDITDLTLLSQYLIGDKKLTDEQRIAADVNDDGILSVSDLALMKQYICLDKVTLGPQA